MTRAEMNQFVTEVHRLLKDADLPGNARVQDCYPMTNVPDVELALIVVMRFDAGVEQRFYVVFKDSASVEDAVTRLVGEVRKWHKKNADF